VRATGPRGEEIPGFAFDEGEDTGAGLAGAEDGVDFPVADARAVLGRRGAGSDRALPGEAAATVIAGVAFAALFAGATEVGGQGAAGAQVIPDVAVDGFMTDGEEPVAAQPPGDLLGAPVFL